MTNQEIVKKAVSEIYEIINAEIGNQLQWNDIQCENDDDFMDVCVEVAHQIKKGLIEKLKGDK